MLRSRPLRLPRQKVASQAFLVGSAPRDLCGPLDTRERSAVKRQTASEFTGRFDFLDPTKGCWDLRGPQTARGLLSNAYRAFVTFLPEAGPECPSRASSSLSPHLSSVQPLPPIVCSGAHSPRTSRLFAGCDHFCASSQALWGRAPGFVQVTPTTVWRLLREGAVDPSSGGPTACRP